MNNPNSNRLYDVYVILGAPDRPPAWSAPVWRSMAAALDPLTRSAWGKAAVRSAQLANRPGTPNQRAVSFGRIGWNEQGHRKWVHQPGQDEDAREFCSVDVWAPSWTDCEREARYPDMYFSMVNEGHALVPAFNPVVLLAVAQDLDAESRAPGESAAKAIGDILAAVLRVRCARFWRGGRDSSTGEWTNNINDLSVSGLFRPGRRHERPVDASLLQGVWEAF